MRHWQSPHGRRLPVPGEKTLIMGVLNATPDSFSDGGRHLAPERAAEHAERMIEEGADILDIGGESTRPGARPVDAAEELDRVLPLLKLLRKRFPDTPLSIDTYKADVARTAVQQGADLINDVWGLTYGLNEETRSAWRCWVERESPSPDLPLSPMAQAAADLACPVILMHNRRQPIYEDFWFDLLLDLRVGIALAKQAGVASHQIWLDPGFGFGKTPCHNLEVLKHLDRLTSLGLPVLLGTSRKSTLGLVLDRPVENRLEGTAATTVWGIAKGCHMVRVHDVAEIRPYIVMADAIRLGLDYPEPEK